MVTGDHPATAAAIAKQVGLSIGEERVLTGAELPEDDVQLGELIDHDGVVIARVAPEQKLRIASALQARGHVVAMTGDGVNDGPALQEADIGIAMGESGSDVAREASDLVLLDDDFTTIVATVEQGRGTFLNVRRFLTYHLTDNVAELFPLVVWALSGGAFPLALGVLQILALDLATDTLTAVALGGERPHGRVMQRPPVSGRLLSRTVAWRSFALLGPTEALLAMTAFIAVLLAGGWQWGTTPDSGLLAQASGAYFITVVAAQMGNAFACRSSTLTIRPPWPLDKSAADLVGADCARSRASHDLRSSVGQPARASLPVRDRVGDRCVRTRRSADRGCTRQVMAPSPLRKVGAVPRIRSNRRRDRMTLGLSWPRLASCQPGSVCLRLRQYSRRSRVLVQRFDGHRTWGRVDKDRSKAEPALPRPLLQPHTLRAGVRHHIPLRNQPPAASDEDSRRRPHPELLVLQRRTPTR